jgi:phage replication initiation protein
MEVENKKQKRKNTIKIDWCALVVMTPEHITNADIKLFLQQYFPEIFENDLFEYRERGKYLYNRSYSFDNIVNFLYNENNFSVANNMGLMIELTGLGLDFVRSRISQEKFEDYLIDVVEQLKADGYEVRIKRLDLAYDDFRTRPYLPLRKIAKKVDNGEFVSKIRKSGILEKNEIVNYNKAKKTGDTVYLGSSSSDTMLRFYDKHLEQVSKNGGCDISDWLRYEVVVKNNVALAIYEEIKNHGLNKTYFSFLNSILRFIEKSNDTNKSRVAVDKFWQKFISSGELIEDFKLKKFKKQENIVGTVDWLVTVSSPLILGQILAKDELSSLDLLDLSDKQLKQVQSFLRLGEDEQQEVVQKLKDIFER